MTQTATTTRYFACFDYVKTTSRITSPYVRVFPTHTTDPDYFAPIIQPEPRPTSRPARTVKLEFEGAANNKGGSGTGFSTDVNIADGRGNVAFRATFVGNVADAAAAELRPDRDPLPAAARRLIHRTSPRGKKLRCHSGLPGVLCHQSVAETQ